MTRELVGYAVLGRQPDLATHEILTYTLESAVFVDPVQADNAHTYLAAKRDAKTEFMVVEIHQLPVRSRQ